MATHRIDDEHLYVTADVRRIDILRFESDPDSDPDLRHTQNGLNANWPAGLDLARLPATQRATAMGYHDRS